MSKQITVPFGPQHPVLPEPIHLDLVLEDERVVDAIPSIGYVHRGLEKLVEKRDTPSTSTSRNASAGSAATSTATPMRRASSRS